MSATVPVAALFLVAAPILLGMLIGRAIRWWWGRRLDGVAAGLAALLLPAAAALGFFVRFPVVGLWDACLEGLLLGVGVVVGVHRRFADPIDITIGALSLIVALAALEVGVSWLLPRPPAFPTAAGLHLGLADAVRVASETLGWEMHSRDVACAVVYGAQYPGVLDAHQDQEIVRPEQYAPRPTARKRILHVGDSMVFGLGVARGETFTAELGRLEPDVEHVNAGIPGVAADAYLAVLQAWIQRRRFDAVVMYLFGSNDVDDLDGPYPCCDLEPLLAYEGGRAGLRCATPRPIDLRHVDFAWLRYNSPPPYLLRALIGRSSAAAYLSAILVDAGRGKSLPGKFPRSEQLGHFAAILRTVRDELSARGIAFAVVILPERNRLEDDEPDWHDIESIIAVSRDLGVPVVNPTAMLRAVVRRGDYIFIGPRHRNDPHFNADGHRLLAEWLHDDSTLGFATAVR